MAQDVSTIDGHVYRSPEDEARNLEFLRKEGAKLLSLYAQVEDVKLRESILDLVKTIARMS